MAKYDQTGKSIWMTPIFDTDDILTVGETNNDYRLMTDENYIYVFSKTDGNHTASISGGDYDIFDAKINKDGTIIVLDYDGFNLIDSNGAFVRYAESDYSTYDYNVPRLIANDNEILITRRHTESGRYEVVGISSDLTSVTDHISSDDPIVAFATSKNGDYIVVHYSSDEDGQTMVESYDKNNNLLGSIDSESFPSSSLVIDDYIFTNDMNLLTSYYSGFGEGPDASSSAARIPSFIAMYSRELKELASLELSEDEIVKDATIINNGTLVTTGGYMTATENSSNGLRIHLIAKDDPADTPTDGTENPKTADAIQIVAIVGGITTLATVILFNKKLARR